MGSGLVCALLTAVVYFSTVRIATWPPGTFVLPRGCRPRPPRSPPPAGRRWVLALPGLALLHWNDDIRELEIPAPDLTRENERISALFGDAAGHAVFLTCGATAADARAALEKFTTWLGSTPAGPGATKETIGLEAVVPTATALAQAVAFGREHPEFPSQLRAALVAAGFDDRAFAPFFEAYGQRISDGRAKELEPALVALAAQLAGPAGQWSCMSAGRCVGLSPLSDRHRPGSHRPKPTPSARTNSSR